MAEETVTESRVASRFDATVTEIRELRRVAGKPVFELALDHPGSCSQSDEVIVTLTATARSGAVLVAPITAVQQDSYGVRWYTTEKPIQPGTRVVANVLAPRV